MQLGNLLELRGWSQDKLASRAGFDPSYISRVVAGTRSPNLANLVRLADALNVSVDALLGRSAPSPVTEGLIRASNAELLGELSRRMT